MRFLIILSLLFSLIAPATSEGMRPHQNEIKLKAQVLDLHLSHALQKAKDATIAISHQLEQYSTTEREFHDRGQKLIEAIGTVRAMIFLDSDGILRYDTHTYPAKNYNLSKREYFIEAIKAPKGQPIVAAPVNGKSSGTSFVPVAKAIYRNNELLGVVVAVVSPRKLINLEVTNDCLSCLSVLTTISGEPIAQEPAELFTDDISDILRTLKHKPSTGISKQTVADKNVTISWRRNATAPIISFHLKFNRN